MTNTTSDEFVMAIDIYGIPTCNTCKKALKWLDEAGVAYTWHNTRAAPPSLEDVTQWVNDLGFSPLRNTSGRSYRALGPEKSTWGDAEWITAFSQDPMLLKRPLFVNNGTALMTGFRGSSEDIKTKLNLN